MVVNNLTTLLLEHGKQKASDSRYRSTMTPTKWYVKDTIEMNQNEVYGVSTDGIETTPNEVYGVSTHPLQSHVYEDVPRLDESVFEYYRLDPLCYPDDLLCSEEEVIDLLLSLNTSKANGPDGISATMLKSTAHSIAPGLTKLFNKSISSGRMPLTWKTSSVVPIPKGDDKSSVKNYRQISLLSIISKLLERHMYWQIATHLEVYYPISLQQWGFQRKKSTTAALLDVYNTWAMEVDKGKEICAIFFDLKKAFDSVPHKSLIEKLTSIGLNPYILR